MTGKGNMNARERLIVALDVDTLKEAEGLVDALADEVEVFKVGIAPFTKYGKNILARIAEKGKKVFLDLKFHDIPNTVRNASRAAAAKNIFMMNFHCIGGKKMMEEAVRGCREAFAGKEGQRPILLGVTVLTSMGEEDLEEVGIIGPVERRVLALASLAKAAGLSGVVASARETKMIKNALGPDFIVVTPGVRPVWAEKGDQKRILSPSEAVRQGADYIVVGRPIIESDDPAGAAARIVREIEEA